MNLKIQFIDSSTGEALGEVERFSISEMIIPHKGDHQVFMNKHFINQASGYWEIAEIQTAQNSVQISLIESRSGALSHGAYVRSKNKKNYTAYLEQWDVVDVDFGHRSNLFDGSDLKENESFFSSHLPGELHKRRPCIVLNVDRSIAQVIPLTTKETASDKDECIAIDEASFKNLAPRYRNQQSYGMTHMLLSVSAFRMFQPNDVNNKPLPYNRAQKVTSADRDKLRIALSSRFNPAAIKEETKLQKRVEDLSKERGILLKKLQTKKIEMEQLKDLLTIVCKDLYGAGDSFEDAIAELKGLYKCQS